MDININDVILYMECPIKYVLSKDTPKMTLKEEFNEAIHKVIYYYYYNRMDDKLIDGQALRKKWGSIWYNTQTPAEIMFNHDTERNELGSKGVSMLLNFEGQTLNTPLYPILLNYDYIVDIGRHHLTGTIELVRETKKERTRKRYIELVDYRADDYLPDEFTLQHDLYLTAQSYAFNKLFDAKEDRIIFSFLRRNRIFYTTRSNPELKIFENIINNVASCIENECFYPKFSSKCKGCRYKCGYIN